MFIGRNSKSYYYTLHRNIKSQPRINNDSLRNQTPILLYYSTTTNARTTEAINHTYTVETASPSFMEANSSSSSILAVIEAVVIVSCVSAASTRHKRSAFASLRPILASGSIQPHQKYSLSQKKIRLLDENIMRLFNRI